MTAPIDFDEWRHVQPVSWRLDPDEQLFAVYVDAGALEMGVDSYIALTDKRVLIPEWEFLYKDITNVGFAGINVELILQTLQGNATLVFLGERQAGYAYRILMVFSGLKYAKR
jgi:hypothetical protein